MNREQIKEAIEKALQKKGTRKFTQSLEAIFNLRGYNASKPENRINLGIGLPKGRGKELEVCVFAEGQMAVDAKKAGAAQVLGQRDIEALGKDKKSLKKMAKKYVFVAAPNMMMHVGRHLGQVLGGRGKMPQPIVGMTVETAIKRAKESVKLVTKGKYLPTVQCAIGTEKMDVDDLVENFEAAYERLKGKVTESSIGKMYVKLTMGDAIQIGAKKKVD